MESGYRYVKMLPWVGENYVEAKLKVLILGVKIHSTDPGSVNQGVTTELVDYYLRYHDDTDYTDGYFDTYDRTIDIIRDDNESREAAWRRVIFFNYTQEPLLKTAQFPNEEQLEYGREALDEIIMRYQPEKILVMGKKLHDYIANKMGDRAQNFGIRTSWTIAIPNSDKIVHLTYFNDPSHKAFDIKQWRQVTRQFLESTPQTHKDPHIRRNIRQILSYLKIDGNEFRISNDYTLLDVLSRAVHNGILHLHPDFGLPENQRLKGGNTIATAYFASCLRDNIHTKDISHKAIRGITTVFEELLMVEKFDIDIDETNTSITFTSKTKRQAGQIFNTIKKNRLQNEPRRLEWKILEELFDTKNLRQYKTDFRLDKEYIKKIDRFFDEKNWEGGVHARSSHY